MVAPSFLSDFFGQADTARKVEGQQFVALHCDVVNCLLEEFGIEIYTDFDFLENVVEHFQFVQHFIFIAVGNFCPTLDPQFGYLVFKHIGLCRVVCGVQHSFTMQTGEDEVLCRKVCDLMVDFLYPLLTACGAVLQFLKLPYKRSEQIFSIGLYLS